VTGTVTTASWSAWSCTVSVSVPDAAALPTARNIVEADMRAMDDAASRFRTDSELSRVNAAPGRPHQVSALLAEAVGTAVEAARITDGLVDPTLGGRLADLGYDRDIRLIRDSRDRRDVRRRDRVAPAQPTTATWRDVVLDDRSLTVPVGLGLDLGATAKALTADRAADRASRRTGLPVLVAVGGDVAARGGGSWDVLVSELPGGPADQLLTTYDGGLATSSTLARRWVTDGEEAHHLLDPRTGCPVDGPWRTATVAAASCVAANTASTAALVLGRAAEVWLSVHGLPARLVGRDGTVLPLGGWPEEAAG